MILQAGMWTVKIIGVVPLSRQVVYFLQRVKPVQVQTLLTNCSVEPLYYSVLSRFSRLNKFYFNVFRFCPLLQDQADELRTIVAANIAGKASHFANFVQRFDQLYRRDALGCFHPQVFSGAFVYHVYDAHALLLLPNHSFAQKIHRPAFIDFFGRQQLLKYPLHARLFWISVQAQFTVHVQPVRPALANFLALVLHVGEYQAEASDLTNHKCGVFLICFLCLEHSPSVPPSLLGLFLFRACLRFGA